MSKLRPFGALTDQFEAILEEAVDVQGHDLQVGEVMDHVYGYLLRHYPHSVEKYVDGTQAVRYYGHIDGLLELADHYKAIRRKK